MECDVFRGIGGVAYKYYLLFQHHLPPPISTYTTDAPQTMVNDGSGVGADPNQTKDTYVLENDEQHPSYIIGKAPGPYVAEHSRSILTRLGARIAFFGIDARTERTRHQVNYPDTYQMIFDRVSKELADAAARGQPITHLVVLLGIPIAYPRLTWLENIFSSPLMGPIKFMNKRFGVAGGFINHFDGGVDLLDDLDDHYTARTHKKERHELMNMLQFLAETYSVRVTILSGDVHLAAIGRFYSHPRLQVPMAKDHRYMVNVISSAIVNKPPPGAVANLLARRNKIHHLDETTDETLMSIFDKDPGESSKKANWNQVTMPSRNWAMITECSTSAHTSVFPQHPETGNNVDAPSQAHNQNGAAGQVGQAQADDAFLSANPGTGERPHSAIPENEFAQQHPTKKPHSIAGHSLRLHSKSKKFDKNLGHSAIGPGEVSAGTTHRAANLQTHGTAGDGALDVAIRVERDQHDKSGQTRSYGMYIPVLEMGHPVPREPVRKDWNAIFGHWWKIGRDKEDVENGGKVTEKSKGMPGGA
jgi:hypothetical protein